MEKKPKRKARSSGLNLPPDIDKMIQQLLKLGTYYNQTHVIHQAVRRLYADELKNFKIDIASF